MAVIKTGQNKGRVPTAKKLIPEGKYLCKVQWVEKGLSNKGKARLRWEFKITVGDQEGKSIYDDTYLSEESLWRFENVVEALGFPEGTEVDVDDAEGLLRMFVGKKVKIRLERDEYVAQKGPNAGKTVENRKVSGYDALDPEVAKRLAAKRAARFGDAVIDNDDEDEDADAGEVETAGDAAEA